MSTAPAPSGWRRVAGSRRWRLAALLLVATAAITVLAVQRAGSSLAYYSTPEELGRHIASEQNATGTHWRVGGRVVAGTIVQEGGRPAAFDIVGEDGHILHVTYDGIVPNLFGPGAFVVIEGDVAGPDTLRASRVIIKHENEFLTATPTPSAAR